MPRSLLRCFRKSGERGIPFPFTPPCLGNGLFPLRETPCRKDLEAQPLGESLPSLPTMADGPFRGARQLRESQAGAGGEEDRVPAEAVGASSGEDERALGPPLGDDLAVPILI